MKKQLFFLLSLFTILTGFTSCASDDWDDEENKVPSPYEEPMDITGVWYQSGAKLSGNAAYLGMHFSKAGDGHALFYAKSAGSISYEEITTNIEGKIVTINGTDVFPGNYLVESVNSSTLKLRQDNSIWTFYKGKEISTANLSSRTYWTFNSGSDYWRYYFYSNGTGKLKTYISGNTSNYDFVYSCSADAGTLIINYTSVTADPEVYDYAAILNNSLVLIYKKDSKTYWFDLY